MNFEDLPDFASLQQLSEALWRQPLSGKGAAVLVGAGFSRNAVLATADTPEPPLWPNLRDAMAKRLYPSSPTSAPADALRLAEEFRAYFGQSALDDFIRASVPDNAWYPGPVHRRLLELPWSEVLTTNWDTLLERAARSVLTHNYAPVHAATDLAHTRSPRIVKLHGTINGGEPYTFAEEDYRTYPARNAAMVNFARQVFIENELCLLGFSGDDPNFLQWSGWVRDHLANSSRRIYLVGVLGLAPASRKLLESRNIAPIDLQPLVQHLPLRDRHAAANELFVSHLESVRVPAAHEWTVDVKASETFIPAAEVELRKTPEYACTKLRSIYAELRSERDTYPGWLVCPSPQRRQLTYQIQGMEERIRVARESLSTRETLNLAVELAWRYETSLSTVSDFAYEFIADALAAHKPSELSRAEHRNLVTVLVRHAREIADTDAFSAWSSSLLALGQHDRDAKAEFHYQQCLHHRDTMNFQELEKCLTRVEGTDPVWALRKACLLATLCRWGDAENLIRRALDDIRERTASARDSIWLRSRRTWCQWLLAATLLFEDEARRDADFSKDTAFHCNPWDEIQSLRTEVETAVRNRAARTASAFTPLFSPGAYRDNSNTMHFASSPVDAPFRTLLRFMECVGMPISAKNVNLINFFPDALSLSDPLDVQWYSWALRYAADDKQSVVNSHLGRIPIARMQQTLAATLYQSVLGAINYWRARATSRNEDDVAAPSKELTNLVSLLFRLTPRCSSDEAVRCFHLGMELTLEAGTEHDGLFGATSDLITHAAKSMSFQARHDACLKALEFPVLGELRAPTRSESWPDPFEALEVDDLRKLRNADRERWSTRVGTLLKLCSGASKRQQPMSWLTSLFLLGELTDAESVLLGEAIWSVTDNVSLLPAGTSLHAGVFLRLPHPEGIDPLALTRRWLFSDPKLTARDKHRLAAVGYAAHERWGAIRPTLPEARALLTEILIDAKAVMADNSLASAFSQAKDRVQRFSGLALGNSVFPVLRGMSSQLFDEVMSSIESIPLPTAVAGLPQLVKRVRLDPIASSIQKGLFGPTFEQVAASAEAIWRWAELGRTTTQLKPPPRLFESLLLALEARHTIGLAAVMHACRLLLEGRHFDDPSKLRLRDAVSAIAREYSYQSIDSMDRRAVSASMVREECVRLSSSLHLESKDGFLYEWALNAINDPLPEVRRAAEHPGPETVQ